jgi:hypothetical protein
MAARTYGVVQLDHIDVVAAPGCWPGCSCAGALTIDHRGLSVRLSGPLVEPEVERLVRYVGCPSPGVIRPLS